MEFKLTETVKGVPCIVFDAHKFRKYRVLQSGTISWRCTKKNCGVQLQTDGNVKTIINYQSKHNHESQTREELGRNDFQTACKRKAAEDLSTRPSKIIRKELLTSENSGLTLKDINNTRIAMYRKRRKTLPKIPKTRKESLQQIQDSCLKTSQGEPFTFVSYTDEIVILTCKENLTFLCLHADHVLADGTFNYSPKHFVQLYTIHGFKNGHYVPLVFSFLPSKTTKCYHTLWNLIVKLAMDLCNLHFQPRIIHLDFEMSAIQAVQETFSNATVQGCRFHLGQAWFRKISSLSGLRAEYSDSKSEVGQWLKMFFGLAFLEPEEVEDGFVDLFAFAPENTSAIAFSDYVLNTYITEGAKFPTKLWAGRPSEDPNTTNGPEAFHKHYNSQFYSPHPSVHGVIAVLQEIQAETSLKMKACLRSCKVLRKSDVEKQKFKADTYFQFSNGFLTRTDYLRKMGLRFYGKKL